MSGWREVERGFPGTLRLGGDDGLHAELRPSFSGRDNWDVTVWGKTGSQTFQEIGDRDEAVALAEYIVGALQPHHDAIVARQNREAAERHAEHEAERPEREAAARKQAAAVAAAPVVEVQKCPECADIFRDGEEGESVYECSRCGGRSLERRCADCNIFAAKIAESSCPHCEAALEETPVRVQAAVVDGQLHEKELTPDANEISVRFDELERRVFEEIASASILSGPEWDEKGPYPRVRLVRRAAEGDRLYAVELAAMKQMLEEATAERQANVDAALQSHDQDLASAFQTWLPALAHAYVLVVEAEAVALGGDAPKVSV